MTLLMNIISFSRNMLIWYAAYILQVFTHEYLVQYCHKGNNHDLCAVCCTFCKVLFLTGSSYMQLKEKALELELADLKLKQHQAKAAQEHTQMVLYAEQVSQLVTTEKTLREQLATDGEKFQHFQVLLQIQASS